MTYLLARSQNKVSEYGDRSYCGMLPCELVRLKILTPHRLSKTKWFTHNASLTYRPEHACDITPWTLNNQVSLEMSIRHMCISTV